ncbi:MAG: type IX secretion system plug protein domain-containing protein, partial [Bacteroidota bacterium]
MMLRHVCLLLGLVVGGVGCGAPSELDSQPSTTDPQAAQRAPALQVVDDAVRTIQLYESSQEVSLPVITLGSGETLTLAFDRLTDEGPEGVEVTFRHTDREGNSDLLPTEYLTGFDRDD